MMSIGSGLLDLSLFRLNLNGVSKESAEILVTFVSLEERSCVDSKLLFERLLLGSFLRELELDLTMSFFRVLKLFVAVVFVDFKFGSDGNRFLPFKWQFSVNADKVDVTLLRVVTTLVSLDVILLEVFLDVFKGLLCVKPRVGLAKLARCPWKLFLVVN